MAGNYDLSKVMSLADGQVMYKDLRDRYDPKYEKPATGIPATDLAAGVIPTIPVTDVQTNGTSILNNGVANIPIGNYNTYGVFKSGYGLLVNMGALEIQSAGDSNLKAGDIDYYPIVPYRQHISVFYALSKLAGEDLKNATVTVGTYPDASKQAIQKLFGFDGIFGDYQNGITASKAYAIGDTFIMDGKRYKVTTAISDGGLITVGTNCVLWPINNVYIESTSVQGCKNGTNAQYAVTPNVEHAAAFYGLAKAAGDTTQTSSDNPVGTYTSQAKTAILTMLGAVGKTDIAGSTGENKGIAYFNGNYGVAVNSETGGVYVSKPSDDIVKAGANDYKPIVPSVQHKSVFYGLAKAAGDTTQAQSNNAVGTYTATAKAAIQSMLGVDVGVNLIEQVSGSTPTLTCDPNVRYECGEVSLISITPPATGTCEVIFTSGSTATLLTVPNTVKFPPWFDATALETSTIYDIIITDGVYGAVMSWAG